MRHRRGSLLEAQASRRLIDKLWSPSRLSGLLPNDRLLKLSQIILSLAKDSSRVSQSARNFTFRKQSERDFFMRQRLSIRDGEDSGSLGKLVEQERTIAPGVQQAAATIAFHDKKRAGCARNYEVFLLIANFCGGLDVIKRFRVMPTALRRIHCDGFENPFGSLACLCRVQFSLVNCESSVQNHRAFRRTGEGGRATDRINLGGTENRPSFDGTALCGFAISGFPYCPLSALSRRRARHDFESLTRFLFGSNVITRTNPYGIGSDLPRGFPNVTAAEPPAKFLPADRTCLRRSLNL